MRRRPLAALERRPWTVAFIAAAGLTLLLPSAAALLLPTDLLDQAIAFGETRLKLGLAALFVVSAVLARLCIRPRKAFEEDEDIAPPVPLVHGGRAVDDGREAPARSYLR